MNALTIAILRRPDQLVAFSVYPDSVSPAIKQAFLEYDRAFAAHLELKLCQPTPDGSEAEIARPISRYWWDDTAWDFEQARERFQENRPHAEAQSSQRICGELLCDFAPLRATTLPTRQIDLKQNNDGRMIATVAG